MSGSRQTFLFYLAKDSTRRAERDWYGRFASDFDQLWQAGRPWTLVEKCETSQTAVIHPAIAAT